MSTLGARLRESRNKIRLTQSEVAKMLDIEGGTISGYERNYRDPDTTTLTKLAKIYGVSVNYLATGRENIQDVANETEQEYVITLFEKITDPVKKQAAIEVLKGLSGEK